MKFFTNENNNYISKSNIKGADRGLFAGKNYKKGEIIDINPFIEVKRNNIIHHYCWGCPWNTSLHLLVLGNINFINETFEKNKQNVNIFHFDKINKKIMCKALKDINKDEELYTFYGKGYDRSNY